MCLKLTSSLFTTTSHKESLSPTFLFLALVTTPTDIITIVFLFGPDMMCVFLLEKWSLKFHTKCEDLTLADDDEQKKKRRKK